MPDLETKDQGHEQLKAEPEPKDGVEIGLGGVGWGRNKLPGTRSEWEWSMVTLARCQDDTGTSPRA